MAWIGAAVGLIGIVVYVFMRVARGPDKRARKGPVGQRSTTVGTGGLSGSGSARGDGQRSRSARCEAERQKMRPLTNYNEEVIDRLVAFERERMPHASEEGLHSAALERLLRDNR